MMCISLISGPYIIRRLYAGTALKKMSDSTELNVTDYNVEVVVELVLRPGRLTCGKVYWNKKLSLVDVLRGLAEIS